MRRDKWCELTMLRELCWLLIGLGNLKCYFCKCSMLNAARLTFGHHHHPPITSPITVHHIDENRDNNDFSNLALCHRECHHSYHSSKRAKERYAAKKGSQQKDDCVQHS